MDNDTDVKTDGAIAVAIDPNRVGAAANDENAAVQELPNGDNVEPTAEVDGEPKVSIENRASVQDGTEPLSDEEMKAERKARMREKLKMRFTIGEHDSEIIEADNQADEEEQVEDEDDISKGSTDGSADGQQKKAGNLESSKHTLIEEEDIDIENMFTDDDDDDDDPSAERGPPKGDTIKAKSDFLSTLEVPSLSDISEDPDFVAMEILRKSRQTMSIAGSVVIDQGRFVNPLTGEYEAERSGSTESSSESSDTIQSTDSDLDFDDDIDFELKPGKDEEEMEIFIKFQNSFINDEEIPEIPREVIAAEKHKRELLKVTIEFLFELFNNVVNDVENVNADILLTNQLDKEKLHRRLTELKNKYTAETEINRYLNGKVSDYFKRQRNFRAFANLDPETDQKERVRYVEAHTLLDHRLNVTAETKHKNAVLMSSVLMDLAYIQNICMYTEEHFEEVIFRTLGNKSDHLNRVVERELRLMGQKRNEISDTRLYLITRKHTLGRIVDKITKLETINEDLCMDDFISIQNQVVALDKKIEERNNELKRMRYNYQSELHVTQHNREKALALASKLTISQSTLKELQEKQRQLREKLYAAKLERSNIRKQQSDLTFQGGLLSMPALMFDYDETVEKVIKKQANLVELKETFKRVNQRIMELETRCT